MEVGPLIEYAANYGFPALFAILFWSYITKVQSEQNNRMRDMEASLTRIEDILFTREMSRSRSRQHGEDSTRNRERDDEQP